MLQCDSEAALHELQLVCDVQPTMCCSVVQCGAVWCSVVQCDSEVALHELQLIRSVAVCCSVLQCVAVQVK